MSGALGGNKVKVAASLQQCDAVHRLVLTTVDVYGAALITVILRRDFMKVFLSHTQSCNILK